MVYDFKQVPHSSSLEWTPCFTNYTCANLLVPFDYEDASVGNVNVAFIRWETPNQPAMGDIVLNPGGPGGSGVDYLLSSLADLTRLFGTSYNVVGMDPRGVNNSGPHVDCFEGKPWVRDYYDNQYYTDFDPHSPKDVLNHWTDAGSFGDWCAQALNETARYANTPATARDMVSYIEALAESKGESKEDAKLDYYGVSYGSTLGTTFASLFPDRVGRMIIDGVVDAEEHYGGSWLNNLRLGDKSMQKFFEYCYEAGPACTFFQNDTSADGVKARFDALLADLNAHPMSVSDPTLVQFPTFLTGAELISWMLLSVYDQNTFPLTASILVECEQRNASSIFELLASAGVSKGITITIACNDMQSNYNISSPEKYQKYIDDLEGVSHYLGIAWSPVITVNCWKHSFVPPQSQIFKGFTTTHTANPILFTTNTIDPVASFADKMVQFYPGSVVLKQDVVGHGLQLAKSKCTSKYLTEFMEKGTLPPAGVVCDVEDPNPFLASAPAKRSLTRRGTPFL
ncbi:alpha/beta-hydrolase [Polyplosphaeria fusca]|uniref:Alpha/beta-hydrolase n=1 Tax=Polyplosphaeria fusca TaxID=682080 RepID=A0A9P4QJ10_9PLEO|nr:alpha/beta-hydrolase [Polyplosphaeria fusca]